MNKDEMRTVLAQLAQSPDFRYRKITQAPIKGNEGDAAISLDVHSTSKDDFDLESAALRAQIAEIVEYAIERKPKAEEIMLNQRLIEPAGATTARTL